MGVRFRGKASGAVDLSENSASDRHSRFRGRSANLKVEEQVEVSQDMAEGIASFSHAFQLQGKHNSLDLKRSKCEVNHVLIQIRNHVQLLQMVLQNINDSSFRDMYLRR